MSTVQPDVTSVYLYDALTIYMTVADEIARADGDVKDSSLLNQLSRNREFRGKISTRRVLL